jgi:hypothetical protein
VVLREKIERHLQPQSYAPFRVDSFATNSRIRACSAQIAYSKFSKLAQCSNWNTQAILLEVYQPSSDGSCANRAGGHGRRYDSGNLLAELG